MMTVMNVYTACGRCRLAHHWLLLLRGDVTRTCVNDEATRLRRGVTIGGE